MFHPAFEFSADGLTTLRHGSLRFGQWPSEAKRGEKGQVVVLPGRGDFLEKYTPLATFLNARGYSVTSLDLPGQGASGRLGQHPQAGHIDSYDDYVVALQVCLEVYKLTDKPQVWVAYSMGALVAMQAVLQHAYLIKGLVLLSPLFGFTEMPERVLRTLANTMCALGFAHRFALGEGPTDVDTWRVEDSRVSSSPTAFAAFRGFLQRHPDYLIGGSTWGWVSASLAAFETLKRADLSVLQLQVLLLSAHDEQTVSREVQRRIARRLPNATFVELPGRHDLLLGEPEVVEALFKQVRNFLDQTSPSKLVGC